MCQHCDRGFPNLHGVRFDRRSLLKTAAAGVVTIGLPFAGPAHAAPDTTFPATTFRGTHGTGFCNSAFFITHMLQLAKQDGVTLQFVNTPTNADAVTFFATGQVDVSVLPYTSFLALHGAGAPVKIVGGGGIQGCTVIAQPGLDTPAKLKGKTLGTFQLDTLEVLPYDWLKMHGLSFNDITVRYLGSTVTLLAPVSPVAWLPVAIFLFGIGNKPAVFMVFIALFFTMVLATITQIDAVNRNYINVARIMGANRRQIFLRVILPAILPGLLIVLRLNLFGAWMVVLIAEATGVGYGLGQVIMMARNTFNPGLVFFTIVLIGVIGFVFDFALRSMQSRILYWVPRGQGNMGGG